jgi:hypothetical protein
MIPRGMPSSYCVTNRRNYSVFCVITGLKREARLRAYDPTPENGATSRLMTQ